MCRNLSEEREKNVRKGDQSIIGKVFRKGVVSSSCMIAGNPLEPVFMRIVRSLRFGTEESSTNVIDHLHHSGSLSTSSFRI